MGAGRVETMEELVIMLVIALSGYGIVQIVRDLFGWKPSNRYAPAHDTSIRIDRRKMARQRVINEMVLLVLLVFVVVGLGLYLFRQVLYNL